MKSKIYRGQYHIDCQGIRRWELLDYKTEKIIFKVAKRGYDKYSKYKILVRKGKIVKTKKVKINYNKLRKKLKQELGIL